MTHAMRPVLSAEAMREADRLTIEEYGIPGFTLMETAGRAAAESIENTWGAAAELKVACFCGKGNNGGDGYVVARILYLHGASVDVFSVAGAGDLTKDAARNYRLLTQLAQHDEDHRLRLHKIDLDRLDGAGRFDLIVDALLGTGLRQELREPYRRLAQWINAKKSPVVSIDIPTGLHTDTGIVLGDCIRADLTVTMGALKTGLMVGEGPRYTGRIETAEIGIPNHLLDQVSTSKDCARIVTTETIRSWLPRRRHDAHKYGVGMAFVVAGSEGLTGAATLASTAAARSGAGAVVCATPDRVQPILAQKMTEVMTLALPSSLAGIEMQSVKAILQPALEKASALLIGCGMGRRPATQAFIRSLLSQTTLPSVIDADGLNAFAEFTDMLPKYAGRQWILTPHLGEFKRLTGEDVNPINRVASVRHYARTWNCILVLKGAPSIVADPDGNVYINPTGNSALATAGTGDVLAGLCTGFLAQGLLPVQAALTALYIGGKAADMYTRSNNPLTMLAGDLIAYVIDAINDLYT